MKTITSGCRNFGMTGLLNDMGGSASLLNAQQKDIIDCNSRLIYVNAGPGSGKTTILVRKLIQYINSSDTIQHLVSLSFTNNAADHVGEKFSEEIAMMNITKDYSLYYGTMHSFCFSTIAEYLASEGTAERMTVLDDEEIEDFAEEIQTQIGGSISDIIRVVKSGGESMLAVEVERIKKKLSVMSVDDMLKRFTEMAYGSISFRSWLSQHITAVAIDEAQDLSQTSFSVLDSIICAIPDVRMFIVGDPRQNIFGFNGGSYKNLCSFLSRHREHEVKNMTITYRFGRKIADLANRYKFTDCDNIRLECNTEDGGTVKEINGYTEVMEAKSVAEDIRSRGCYSETAVLCNNLAYLKPVMDMMKEMNIHYRVFGGRRILKPHIRLLKHILRVIDNENEYSMRFIARQVGMNIGTGIKESFYSMDIGRKILKAKADGEGSVFSILANVLNTVMRKPEDGSSISEDYSFMFDASREFDTIQSFLWDMASNKEKYAQLYEKEYPDFCDDDEDDFVTVSTIHSAKGLEWDNVYIMGLSEGNFPNPYFCRNMSPKGQAEFYNDETKKMYVAVTRARKMLCLSYSDSITRKGYTFSQTKSRFIMEDPIVLYRPYFALDSGIDPVKYQQIE